MSSPSVDGRELEVRDGESGIRRRLPTRADVQSWANPHLLISVVVLAYLGIATSTRSPLMWDGSYYLFRILDDGQPFVVYQRYSVVPLHLPTLVVGRLSGSVDAASYVLSFTYALVPVLILGAAWCWHRIDRPALLWSVVGVTASVMPAQAFFVGEAVIAVQIWCPLLMLAISGRWTQHRWSGLIAVILLLGMHPVAAPLLAALALAVAVRPRVSVHGLVAASVLAVLSVVRFIMLAGYETDGLPTITRAISRSGFVNSAAFGLLMLAIVLGTVLAMHEPRRTLLRSVMWTCGSLALALFCVAAADPAVLGVAAGARFALVGSALAWGAIAAFHIVVGRGRNIQALTMVALIGAGTYLVYQAVASISWHVMVENRVEPLLASPTPCVSLSEVPALRGTPLATWSTSALVIVLQGRNPSHLLLPYDGCTSVGPGAPILLLDAAHGGPRERDAGWFDLRRAGLGEQR